MNFCFKTLQVLMKAKLAMKLCSNETCKCSSFRRFTKQLLGKTYHMKQKSNQTEDPSQRNIFTWYSLNQVSCRRFLRSCKQISSRIILILSFVHAIHRVPEPDLQCQTPTTLIREFLGVDQIRMKLKLFQMLWFSDIVYSNVVNFLKVQLIASMWTIWSHLQTRSLYILDAPVAASLILPLPLHP